MKSDYENAKKELLAGSLKTCPQFFAQNGFFLEYAYCNLISENLEDAQNIAHELIQSDIRAHWLLFLISLIKGEVSEYPTYFEIRNFLEIDLHILMTFFKGDYIEKILQYSNYMYSINPETYKFIGRFLYNSNMEEQAMYFLDKAKNFFYNDPELHYLLGYIYYNKGKFPTAKKHLQNCLNILPNYFPAVNLISKL